MVLTKARREMLAIAMTSNEQTVQSRYARLKYEWKIKKREGEAESIGEVTGVAL